MSSLLPAFPLPAGNTIPVQHLLDHVAGLPGDLPLFPDGGLWTAYAPGAHWHYSNTAYDMLGKLAEHFGGKPLNRLLQDRDLCAARHAPQPRRDHRGRPTLYAQGYEAADQSIPIARGLPLAPTAWVDVTFGAGSVASTADDMNRFFRTLANAVQGRGGLGLSPERARAFTDPCGAERHRRHDLRQRPDACRQCRPLLPSPHRRNGQLLVVIPRRCRERRHRLRELDDRRVRGISAETADALRGRCADQRAWRPARAAAPSLNVHGPARGDFDRTLFRTFRFLRGARRRAANLGRQRPVCRAPAAGRRSVRNHPSRFSPICAEVRAEGTCDHRRQLGSLELFARWRGGRAARLRIRSSRSSPAATSTTARGSAWPSSSSAAVSCGSAPKPR